MRNVTHELWIKIADNGLVVRECDDEGITCSTIVMEGDEAPAKLGNLVLEYLENTPSFDNDYHIKMEII